MTATQTPTPTGATPTAPISPGPGARRRQTRRAFHDMRFTLVLVGGMLLVSFVAIGIGLAVYTSPSTAPKGDVQVTTVDYAIHMPTSLATGKHVIGLTNKGKVGHELVIFKTALPGDKLPVNADGDVVEDSPLLTSVADSGDGPKVDAESVPPGQTESFKTDEFTPGHYVAVCNLPGHYKLGMWLNVTVQ